MPARPDRCNYLKVKSRGQPTADTRHLDDDGFPDRRQKQLFSRCARCRERGSMIELDRRERIVMHADKFRDADEFRRAQRILNSHGEEIANREDGEIQFGPLPDQLHVVG